MGNGLGVIIEVQNAQGNRTTAGPDAGLVRGWSARGARHEAVGSPAKLGATSRSPFRFLRGDIATRGGWMKARDPLRAFCRQVRARSAEHQQAMQLLSRGGLHSPAVALLRQELDSLIRVMYVLSIKDRVRRLELIRDSVEGREWRHPNGRRITDREMVQLCNRLTGWAASVYRFGCAFIHLSHFHDRMAFDPFKALPRSEQREVLSHLARYHGAVGAKRPGMSDLVPYIPSVFQKIADNLHCYLDQLERGQHLDA